jgi:hypothetical protein
MSEVFHTRRRLTDHAEGRSLVWVLSQLRAGVEAKAIEELEAKLDKVAEIHGVTGNGQQGAARQTSRIDLVVNTPMPPPQQVALVLPADWGDDLREAVWAEHVATHPADAGALQIVWLRKCYANLDDEPSPYSSADQESWRAVARRQVGVARKA